MNSANKIKYFIIGLPRTGTTSICKAMLELGFTVAHTAYTQKTFKLAQVIADTPVFSDFNFLEQQYPQARFIYLQRNIDLWIPSIRQLLLRMHPNVVTSSGGFNPIIKHSYQQIFSPFTVENINSDEFLTQCYTTHQQQIKTLFSLQPEKLLSLNISETDSYSRLTEFLMINPDEDLKTKGFEKLNTGGKITAWKDIKHPNKIASVNERGQADKVLTHALLYLPDSQRSTK